MALQLTHFARAIACLERALRQHDACHDHDMREVLRAGVIKNYELAYEVSWKMMQRWLIATQDVSLVETLLTRRDLFRLAAQFGMIADPEPWFVFHKMRNEGAHIYQEAVACRALATASEFVPAASELAAFLEAHNA